MFLFAVVYIFFMNDLRGWDMNGVEGLPERGLEPVVGEAPRILILGSFPSARSLLKGQYYGHERNHFWPIIAAIAGRPQVPEDYAERLDMLRSAGISLWDVYAQAVRRRPGSLDSDLAAAEPNPVEQLLRAHPGIAVVGLNGGEAAAAFARRFGLPALTRACDDAVVPLEGRTRRVLRLPSSSPVPSARYRTFEDRLAVWRRLLDPQA